MRLLIKNGRLIDPANKIDDKLNLLVENGKVKWIGLEAPEADEIIDASDCVVCPGFIDMHMHEDPMGDDGHIRYGIFNCMLRMGVTTCIGGNCGSNSAEPTEYLSIVDRDGAPVNVALLAGHSYFRKAAGAKDRYGKATEEQREQMVKDLNRALEGGCLGVSFGVRYVPGTDLDELKRAAACCKASGKPIAAHVRDDAAAIFESIEEVAALGREFELPVQISHIGSMGGFGQMAEVLKQIDRYCEDGLNIAMDCYPYEAFSTGLGETTYDDGWLERYNCDYNVLEFCEGPYKGQRATAETFAQQRRDNPKCITVCHVMKKEDIDLAYKHPLVAVASDGVMNNGNGHPRAAGTFPRYLRKVIDEGTSLYDAVEKMTALPARLMQITDKGNLSIGSDADITIFAPEKVRDTATFEHPATPPEGIEYVIVGGQVAAQNGVVVNGKLGRSVRKPQSRGIE